MTDQSLAQLSNLAIYSAEQYVPCSAATGSSTYC